MKVKLKAVMSAFVAAGLLCACASPGATGLIDESRETYAFMLEQELREYFADFYDGEGSYQILDFDGQDITERFYADTWDLYALDDMAALRLYFEEHVSETTKETAQSEPVPLSDGDLMKTVTREKTELCTTPEREDSFYITYQVRISFFYNPNTFVVSSAGLPVFGYQAHWGDAWSVHVSQNLPYVQTHGVDVTVTQYFNVTADYYGKTYDFGRHGCTFTVNADSPGTGTLE